MNDFPKKWDKVLEDFTDGFKNDADNYSEDDLKKCIVDSNKSIAFDEQTMDEDNDLAEAKEEAKRLAAPYKDSIKTAQAKSRYCVWVMKNRTGGS